jgi:hypothetical protein
MSDRVFRVPDDRLYRENLIRRSSPGSQRVVECICVIESAIGPHGIGRHPIVCVVFFFLRHSKCTAGIHYVSVRNTFLATFCRMRRAARLGGLGMQGGKAWVRRAYSVALNGLWNGVVSGLCCGIGYGPFFLDSSVPHITFVVVFYTLCLFCRNIMYTSIDFGRNRTHSTL